MIWALIFLAVGVAIGGAAGLSIGVAMGLMAAGAAEEEWIEEDDEDIEVEHRPWCMATLTYDGECDCAGGQE